MKTLPTTVKGKRNSNCLQNDLLHINKKGALNEVYNDSDSQRKGSLYISCLTSNIYCKFY